MSLLSMEYLEAHYGQPLRGWWDWHPDKVPTDFAPMRVRYAGTMTEEEEVAYWEGLIADEQAGLQIIF
jgi:hypothetical protein